MASSKVSEANVKVAAEEDVDNHLMAIGFQENERLVLFSTAYDSSLGKTVEAIQGSRLLQLEEVESRQRTGVARMVFRTKKENCFVEGHTLERRVEHASRLCLLLDLLSSVGWRPLASGAFLQERLRGTILLKFVLVPKAFDFVRAVQDVDKKELELKVRNYLGLISTLENLSLTVAASVNPFGDGVDSLIFYHEVGKTTEKAEKSHQFFGLGLTQPKPLFAKNSNNNNNDHEPLTRRRSSVMRMKSSDEKDAQTAMEEQLREEDDNPFKLRFFAEPQGIKTLVLGSCRDLLCSLAAEEESDADNGSLSLNLPLGDFDSSLWECKSVAGKAVAAYLVRDLLFHGWRLRLTLNGIFDHSVLVFQREHDVSSSDTNVGNDSPLIVSKNDVSADVLHLSVLSNKKLCVGMVPRPGAQRLEAKLVQSKLVLDVLNLVTLLIGHQTSSTSSSSTTTASSGSNRSASVKHKSGKPAETGPTVVKFAPMAFTSNKQTGFEVLMRLVSGLWHSGWRLDSAANLSGVRPPTTNNHEESKKHSWSHTIFMTKAHPLQIAHMKENSIHHLNVHLYPQEEEAVKEDESIESKQRT